MTSAWIVLDETHAWHRRRFADLQARYFDQVAQRVWGTPSTAWPTWISSQPLPRTNGGPPPTVVRPQPVPEEPPPPARSLDVITRFHGYFEPGPLPAAEAAWRDDPKIRGAMKYEAMIREITAPSRHRADRGAR